MKKKTKLLIASLFIIAFLTGAVSIERSSRLNPFEDNTETYDFVIEIHYLDIKRTNGIYEGWGLSVHDLLRNKRKVRVLTMNDSELTFTHAPYIQTADRGIRFARLPELKIGAVYKLEIETSDSVFEINVRISNFDNVSRFIENEILFYI